MRAYETELRDSGMDASLVTDAQMVARLRLVLSVSALLVAFVDARGWRTQTATAALVFSGYILHSLVILLCTQPGQPLFQRRSIHWMDVIWFTLIVLSSGGIHSAFFLFYFFVILAASFRWGQDEGARVTIASVAAYVACGLATATQSELPLLLMRAAFLLALGYMIAHWGESKVDLRRRMALLLQVGGLSNPRFGAGQTLGRVMAQVLAYFGGSTCLLLIRDKDTGACLLRTLHAGETRRLVAPEPIDADAAQPLMALPPGRLVLCNRAAWPLGSQAAAGLAWDPAARRWVPQPVGALSELLDARAFISAPLSMRQGEGRIIVVASGKGRYRKADAQFLGHIVAQVFPVIENIEVLDHMASDAASAERQRIALDLHDTAIQPYIGLKMGLAALHNRAGADNPLRGDIDHLLAMADKVIGELRRYAGAVRLGGGAAGQVLLPALHRQAAQVRGLYGIDIDVGVDGDIELDDRLAAEVLQMVREGLSNICRHTNAQRGTVRIGCTQGRLRIRIENETPAGQAPAAGSFQPRSITERATALGGSVQIACGAGGRTALLVEIPI